MQRLLAEWRPAPRPFDHLENHAASSVRAPDPPPGFDSPTAPVDTWLGHSGHHTGL